MVKRKKDREIGLGGASRDIVVGGSVLGIGATVVARVGGSTAGAAGAGLSVAASFLPIVGVTVGSGVALQQLRKLQGQTEQRKRRKG